MLIAANQKEFIPSSHYDYLKQDMPTADILTVLGTLPQRWGRMDRISRLAVVEVGRALLNCGWQDRHNEQTSNGGRGGLIGLTRRGSLATDLAFVETMKEGVALASPTLFSYTLANIALAEAASHYNLTGPVYSVFTDNPTTAGEDEARRWLACDASLDFMIVAEVDVYPAHQQGNDEDKKPAHNLDNEIISVNFKIVS